MNIGFNQVIPIFLFTLFAFVIGSLLVKVFKYGGFRAALFGAKLGRVIGEVSGGSMLMGSTALKVYTLGGAPERAVGVELVTKTFASYHTMPVALSSADAQMLIGLLQSAVAESGHP